MLFGCVFRRNPTDIYNLPFVGVIPYTYTNLIAKAGREPDRTGDPNLCGNAKRGVSVDQKKTSSLPARQLTS